MDVNLPTGSIGRFPFPVPRIQETFRETGHWKREALSIAQSRSITAEANSLVFTSVASSIRRAKS